MLGDPLQELIDGIEYEYNVSCARLYGTNSITRGGFLFEDSHDCEPAFLYVYDTLLADLIMKNENKVYNQFVPRIEKAVKAILSHSPQLDLEPDEWPVMLEIAQRVKDNLPNILIVPDSNESPEEKTSSDRKFFRLFERRHWGWHRKK